MKRNRLSALQYKKKKNRNHLLAEMFRCRLHHSVKMRGVYQMHSDWLPFANMSLGFAYVKFPLLLVRRRSINTHKKSVWCERSFDYLHQQPAWRHLTNDLWPFDQVFFFHRWWGGSKKVSFFCVCVFFLLLRGGSRFLCIRYLLPSFLSFGVLLSKIRT